MTYRILAVFAIVCLGLCASLDRFAEAARKNETIELHISDLEPQIEEGKRSSNNFPQYSNLLSSSYLKQSAVKEPASRSLQLGALQSGALQSGNAPFPNLRINDPSQETGARTQNTTSSAVSGRNIAVAFNDIGDEIAAVSYSNDGGQTWRTAHIPPFRGGANMGLGAVAARGNDFYYAGTAVTSGRLPIIISSVSTDAGRTWTEPAAVMTGSPVLQDKPWIAVDDSSGPNSGAVYISWIEFGTRGSRIICAASTDGGRTFPITAAPSTFDDTFNIQAPFVAVGPDGDVNIAWGDERVNGIKFARSNNGGRLFTREKTAAAVPTYRLVGPLLNSHFGANGFPSLAVAKSGPNRGALYIVFSAPSPERPADKADVFFVRSTDQGVNWTEPKRLNDDEGVTDQFMPSIAAAADGSIAAMWYDRRNDSIHNGLMDVYSAASIDGGDAFAANRRITSSSWLVVPAPLSIAESYHGFYNQMSALTDSPGFFFVWGDDRSGFDADVYGARIDARSLIDESPSLTLAPLTPSQTVVAGRGAALRLKVKRSGALNGETSFAGASDDGAISFDFDNFSAASDEVIVRVRTGASVAPGSHPIAIRASLGSVSADIVLRLNVLSPGPFARLPLNVSESPARSIQPFVSLDRIGAINMVWADDRNGKFRVEFSRSTDGAAFSNPVEVSRSGNRSLSPSVAVDRNDLVHAAWQDCDDDGVGCRIMYSRSTDQGATFSLPQLLSFGIEFSEQPAIATSQAGEVAVFWNGTRARSVPKFEIFNAHSTDGGATFNSMNTVASSGSANLYAPSIASDGAGNTYVSYESCDGSCRIEVRRSTSNLSSFGSPVVVSNGVFFAFKSSIAALSDGTVHVAMAGALKDGDPRFEIFTASSFDKGASFAPAKNVSNTPEASNDPTIAADGRKVYVAWLDVTPGNKDIFLAVSEDAGTTFSAATNLSSNVTISQVPTLAVDSSGTVHMGFEDETDGNDEAYYSRLAGTPKPASILSIEPDKGAPGTSVLMRGAELSSVSSVDFNGIQAEFFIDSTSSLVAIVPAGARSGSINVQTSAGAAASQTSFTVTSAITVNASLVDFGFVVPGQALSPKEVLIKNLGAAPLKISALSISGPEFQLFSPPQLPLELAPNAVLRLSLNFRPTVEGERSGSLKIGSNDSVLPSIAVMLTGRAGMPALTLFAPNGGEKLRGGDGFFIQWNADNQNFTGFDLLLSTDGGQTFVSTIAAGLNSQARNFTWTVPSVKTKTARVAIVGRTSNGLIFMDQSDANFKIKAKRQ